MENNEIIIHKLNRIEKHIFGLKAILNVEELSDEQVEELYNDSSELIDALMKDEKVQLLASASDILEKIEALVKAEIQ